MCGDFPAFLKCQIFFLEYVFRLVNAIFQIRHIPLDLCTFLVHLFQVFSSLDLRIAMPHETNLFSAVNRDFRILMKATEKNPNVLQACSRISESKVV